jgi:curved DNA-binding protein CbpA
LHDYYDILDVSRTAGADEIRRSFRRKAKECHPDHNGHRTEWAQARTRLVIEAYHVLRDVERRLEYDMMLAQDPETARKKFWAKWEHARRNDESVAGKMRLMLHYLLTERGGEAVEIYRELRANNGKTDLKGHLSDRDHFDCLFLLAEELERMGDVVGAAEQYAEMYRTLRTKPVRAYLHMEVRNRLYCLLTRGLPRKMGKKNSARYYIDALKMRLSKAEQAFVHKKLAECHLARGERELAAEHLRTAFGLKPGLKGTKKIVEQLQARGSNAKEKFRFETSGGV